MPHKKYADSPLLVLVKKVGLFFYAFGQPPLFALKILLWTIFWTINLCLEIGKAIISLTIGTWDTAVWFAKAIFSSILELKKLKLPTLPKFVLPKIVLPKVTLPKITLPKIPSTPLITKLKYLFLGATATFIFTFIPFWVKTGLDQLPNPKLLAVRDIPVSTKIYDRNGILLYQIYTDENRSLVSLSQVPKYLVNATIAIEDKNFYHHLGFDPAGIVRAAFANADKNNQTQGGSTITQQLVKSVLLSPERTWQRKIKELILAFWAERIYSKDQILTMYLNQISYGGSSYGIEAAAQTYFNKHATDLTLSEAALLAGLPSSPTTYSPFGSQPQLAKERQKMVLTAMESQGYISSLEAKAALSQDLKFSPQETSIKAPHFVMYVRDLLAQKYGNRKVEQGGLEVITTLDYSIYENVNKLVASGVDAQKYLNVGNGAALVTNPKNGEILTMVGSINFFDLAHDGNVNVTLAQRSPGSSIKPLNYALAFENKIISPSTIIDDSPVKYPNYAPQNYDNKFHGKVTVRTALGSSYNIPAVKVLEKNGVTNFVDFATKMGISTFIDPSRYGLALTLGGGEVTMTDMATAYSAFANQGKRVDLNPVLKVTDYRGKVLEDNTATSTQVISPQTAFLISDILADNNARAPAFGPSSALVIPGHTVSVKTGTTQEKRDNWTIGYTPSVLVAVWVGNNNNSPMSMALESGNTGAAAIWNPIMQFLLANKPDEGIARPDNIIPVQVCSLNGLLPCEFCPFVRTEYFTTGTEPKTACNFTKEEVDKILHPEAPKPNP